MGHRRFSIIDLSEGGHQPLIDPTGRFGMVYNGELYNYRELRSELVEKGARFISSCDTEVVLEAYKTWGVNCFTRFNGFWALAIYDSREDFLLCARDRVGKKPLFYTLDRDRFCFASEIKSLLASRTQGGPPKVNETAVWNWLALGKKNVGDETFFEGIHLFPKASYAIIEACGDFKPVPYWRLPDRRMSAGEISINEACNRTRDLLYDAVSLRLRSSDVPVALELSGGIDSSVIAACVAGERNPPPAYHVRFPGTRYDESVFAHAVADRCGLELIPIEPGNVSFWKHLGGFTHLQEEPYHSPNIFSEQVNLMRMRAAGIKVCLNGAGGDELFGGYPSSFWTAQIELLRNLRFSPFIRNAFRYSEQANPLLRFFGFIPYAAARSIADRFPLLGKGYRLHVSPDRRTKPRTPLTATGRLHADMNRMLMPYWLVSGDRQYMGVPVEVREPMLDYRIVELAFRLPVEYLIRDGWHKWLLRKAFERELPPEVVWRRRKMGFPFPIGDFSRESGELLSYFGSTNPYISLRGPVHSYNWKVVSFLLWYDYFIRKDLALFSSAERRVHGGPDSKDYFTPAYLTRPEIL